jgi:hypothetical protein
MKLVILSLVCIIYLSLSCGGPKPGDVDNVSPIYSDKPKLINHIVLKSSSAKL